VSKVHTYDRLKLGVFIPALPLTSRDFVFFEEDFEDDFAAGIVYELRGLEVTRRKVEYGY